ncbi:MAG: DUF4839 domain-containing protein [Bacillota bacterium]
MKNRNNQNQHWLYLAVVAVITLLFNLLIKRKEGESPKKKIILWGVLILLFVGVINNYNNGRSNTEQIKWDNIHLNTYLPKIKNKLDAVIYANTKENLYLSQIEMNRDTYEEYLLECIDFGFEIDGKHQTSSYSAYDDEGYFIELMYYDNDLSLNLHAPMAVAPFTWSNQTTAKSLPTPQSNIGKYEWNRDNGFLLYVSDTTENDYITYVNECIASGFDVDIDTGSDYLYAKDIKDNRLTLNYEGNRTMRIELTISDEQVESPASQSSIENDAVDDEINSDSEDQVSTNEINDPEPPTEKEETEVIHTIDNNQELNEMLNSKNWQGHLDFAEKYNGEIIEFDASIVYLANHESYNTRYDLLIQPWDYVDANTANAGPIFQMKDINMTDMGIKDLFLPSFIVVGGNVKVKAIMKSYNETSELFEIKPVLVEER